MHLTSFLILFTALFSAALALPDVDALIARFKSHINNEGVNGTKINLHRECAVIRQLTTFTALTTNQTKLNELADLQGLNAAQMQKLKDEGANATAKLNTLTSNATLVSECQQLNAAKNGNGMSASKIIEEL
jgi:hypothetical protein